MNRVKLLKKEDRSSKEKADEPAIWEWLVKDDPYVAFSLADASFRHTGSLVIACSYYDRKNDKVVSFMSSSHSASKVEYSALRCLLSVLSLILQRNRRVQEGIRRFPSSYSCTDTSSMEWIRWTRRRLTSLEESAFLFHNVRHDMSCLQLQMSTC
jgi:hypothetical protein